MYRATNLAAGATVRLAITGIKAAAGEADAAAPATGLNARNVAVGGAFLLVLLGTALLLLKKPQGKKGGG
jgi:hypothetical protein